MGHLPTNPTAWQPSWANDWATVRQHAIDWWAGRGLLASISAPADAPRLPESAEPRRPASLRDRWLDPAYRAGRNLDRLNRTAMISDFLPIADTNVGAGDLAAMLGASWDFAPDTVWFTPCITDPQHAPPLVLDRDNPALQALLAMVRRCVEVADGRYFVGMPDLIENLDILAALRDPNHLLVDLIERPAWVLERLDQINDAYFAIYDLFYDIIKAPDGSCAFAAFCLWGPGKTAKVQCDIAAMISPSMFRQFVVPALTAQCDWLDYSMYHLDGPEAVDCLDALLEIDSLNAVQWTPKSGTPGPGDPCWYDLYRRIKQAGKAVQPGSVRQDQLIPLLEAIGPEGVYVRTHLPDPRQAEALLTRIEQFR
jgi:hypothetical protein